jgi:nitroreductase
LYIDTKRNVGALDPYLREEHIGMGCALENLMLAAAANGYQTTLTLFSGKLGPIPDEPKPELSVNVSDV